MERLRSVLFIADVIIALVAGLLGFLWSIDAVDVHFFEWVAAAVNGVRLGGFNFGRGLSITLGGWILLIHVLYAICAPFFSKYDTHIRSKTNDGEVSMTVAAFEETLSRTVGAMSELFDARVSVYRERKHPDLPVRIFAACAAYEGCNVREVTEKVREVIKLRLAETVEMPQSPLIEICVSRIVPRESRKEAKKRPKDSSLEFRGPEYPIDAEQED
ncbi:MAG: hypothetical protein HYZ53_03710 [Planctomycetes bacterium]|nr:hypothetical protein [Planctomycetota bacterium]